MYTDLTMVEATPVEPTAALLTAANHQLSALALLDVLGADATPANLDAVKRMI